MPGLYLCSLACGKVGGGVDVAGPEAVRDGARDGGFDGTVVFTVAPGGAVGSDALRITATVSITNTPGATGTTPVFALDATGVSLSIGDPQVLGVSLDSGTMHLRLFAGGGYAAVVAGSVGVIAADFFVTQVLVKLLY